MLLITPTIKANITPLNKQLNDGNKNIIWIEAHTDDEFMLPGIIAFAHGKGNIMRIIAVQCQTCCNPILLESRLIANQWLLDNYLESYDYLGFNLSQPNINWGYIRYLMKQKIEEYHPDIIICNSPYGYNNKTIHKKICYSINIIYNQLSYNPEIYWIINTNQDLPHPPKNLVENILFPPTDTINLDKYLFNLSKTIWDAKVQIWENYSATLPQLANLLNNQPRMYENDRIEYFRRYR